ncbi:putative DsbA family dithiol-disulfide isomerase [Deinobacterium chartae]|uniref:Putative DsbA family dithiol-disulfide isomerase n=1 Tax=Deinobacterium chartae TaxID=521158 RepID=A0A841I159_9DEIO|nr:putative DsbA family dithiol-disulfide isomerase [Deinobacterium chartae]
MINIYFDYLCPVAWRAVELAYALEQAGDAQFELRHYSLEQGNHPDNAADRHSPVWKLAEQPQEGSRSLPQFLASHAARRQGRERFFCYVLELFRLYHVEKRQLTEPQVLREAAERAGLDLAQFDRDLQDEAGLRAELASDLEAADRLGVFGTPTVQLESGRAAYFRFTELPETLEDKRALWQLYRAVQGSPARIETIKRARFSV